MTKDRATSVAVASCLLTVFDTMLQLLLSGQCRKGRHSQVDELEFGERLTKKSSTFQRADFHKHEFVADTNQNTLR